MAHSSVWANLRQYPRRLIAVLVALAIGIGFAVASTVFTSTSEQDIIAKAALPYTKLDLHVGLPPGQHADLLAHKLFSEYSWSAEPVTTTLAKLPGGSYGQFSTIPYDRSMRYFTLSAGTWPTDSRSVIVEARTAREHSLTVGTTFAVGEQITVTVTGITELPVGAQGRGAGEFFGLIGLINDLGGNSSEAIGIRLPHSTTESAARATIATLCHDCSVSTASERGARAASWLLRGMAGLQTMLLAFAALALVVTGLVLANTFTILFAQRQRDSALQRCIGATIGQVRRQLIAEAASVGAAGSALGVVIGVAAGWAGSHLAEVDFGGIGYSPTTIAALFALGVVVATVAGTWPALQAAKVRPLAALRPAMGAIDDAPSGRGRLIIGLILFVGGTGTMFALGNQQLLRGQEAVLGAVAAGAVSAIGALILTRSVAPVVLRVLAPAARLAGMPGQLGAANAQRNPRRSAATAAALMVGVGLIVMMQTAAASIQATTNAELDKRYPVDLSISAESGTTIPAELTDRLRTLGLAPGELFGTSGQVAGRTVAILAPSPAALAGTRSKESLSDTQILLPRWWEPTAGTVTVQVAGHSAEFQVRRSDLAGIYGETALLSEAALRALGVPLQLSGLWAALPAGGQVGSLAAGIQQAVSEWANVSSTGAISKRADFEAKVRPVLTLVTALLAVAVVIALVGVGNTIALSVLERTRESALQRALGLRRRELATSILVEASLLAAVGVAAGTALGVLYGWGGVRAALGTRSDALVLVVPWPMVALIAGVTVFAGLMAAVLPAYRSARLAPSAALADLG